MSDIIKLLPDSVANQIAAGEVVQRPASVVKELLENSVDAGATDIKLIVKDAGRTLIQVTDNGKGMSENDARMCFERHATSKITTAQDLFALRTMGFRGEALASIASVARVELKTRMADNTLGTEIVIEGSRIESLQQCQAPMGTTIAVKNLFFNTPARRNFLKSDTAEKGHLFNEFIRIALANPKATFSYYHNNQLITQAASSNLGNRILNLFGNHYKSRLIPVEESTMAVSLQGYVLKPEYARKSKSEQFFFVNNRYIRSSYLNHAIESGFEELIPANSYPSFFLFLEIDSAQIDVNVHPTKTEIKFQDEKTIYHIIKAAIKRSLGKFNIVPSLDFERETAFDHLIFDKNKPVVIPTIDIDPTYNPFKVSASPQSGRNLTARVNPANWEKLFPDAAKAKTREEIIASRHETESAPTLFGSDQDEQPRLLQPQKFIQFNGRYIVSTLKSGILVVDQHRAHERVLFEKQIQRLDNHKITSQTLLFPEKLNLSESDMMVMSELADHLTGMGFDLSPFGNNAFMVNAVPAEIPEHENITGLITDILDNYKKNSADIKLDTAVNLAKSMAKSLALKPGKTLSPEEMNALTDELFSCQMPQHTPSGKPVFQIFTLDEIADKFK